MKKRVLVCCRSFGLFYPSESGPLESPPHLHALFAVDIKFRLLSVPHFLLSSLLRALGLAYHKHEIHAELSLGLHWRKQNSTRRNLFSPVNRS